MHMNERMRQMEHEMQRLRQELQSYRDRILPVVAESEGEDVEPFTRTRRGAHRAWRGPDRRPAGGSAAARRRRRVDGGSEQQRESPTPRRTATPEPTAKPQPAPTESAGLGPVREARSLRVPGDAGRAARRTGREWRHGADRVRPEPLRHSRKRDLSQGTFPIECRDWPYDDPVPTAGFAALDRQGNPTSRWAIRETLEAFIKGRESDCAGETGGHRETRQGGGRLAKRVTVLERGSHAPARRAARLPADNRSGFGPALRVRAATQRVGRLAGRSDTGGGVRPLRALGLQLWRRAAVLPAGRGAPAVAGVARVCRRIEQWIGETAGHRNGLRSQADRQEDQTEE